LWNDHLVPDTRSQRGAHPKDEACFDIDARPALELAVRDLSWLLESGYPDRAALKLVGDRYALRDRQRKAVQRGAVGDTRRHERWKRRVELETLRGERVDIDGYNVLLTVESALSGARLFRGRDGLLRDLAALSRHFKRVDVTAPAVDRIAAALDDAGVRKVRWLLDRPISNSGRLRQLIENRVTDRRAVWTVELTDGTDRHLIKSSAVVATADSAILERCERWFHLALHVVQTQIPAAEIIDWSAIRIPTLDSETECRNRTRISNARGSRSFGTQTGSPSNS